jgi:hypothetical protein
MANVKQVFSRSGMDPCLLCTRPISTGEEEPDALLCSQCGVAYHRICAPDWTYECYECLGKGVVSKWTAKDPPPELKDVTVGMSLPRSDTPPWGMPGTEEVDNEGVCASAPPEAQRSGITLTLHCNVEGCDFYTKANKSASLYLRQHQLHAHGIEEDEASAKRRKAARGRLISRRDRQPYYSCRIEGCFFESKHKPNFTRHLAGVHGIGDVSAELRRREKDREWWQRQPFKVCDVDGCVFQTKKTSTLNKHKKTKHRNLVK